MSATFARFRADQSGITAIEYGVLACFISVALITVIHLVGMDVSLTLKHATAFIARGQSYAH